MNIKHLVLFVLVLYGYIFAWEDNIRFESFPPNKELEGKIVYKILQDHLGFIWIGTNDGLFKYDGYKLTAYKNDRLDSTSLGNNDVIPICEDSNGTLWFGTSGGGVNKYDRSEDKFIRIKHNPKNSNSINNDVIRLIFEDSLLKIKLIKQINHFRRSKIII